MLENKLEYLITCIKEQIRNLKYWHLYGKGFFDRYDLIILNKGKKKITNNEELRFFSGQPRNHVC